MSYTALYRKFRPDNFTQVQGQDHIVTTLKNQVRSGRTGHAYLFCGTRGTGKTSIAKILAKAVNCENPVDGDPCGVCPTCQKIKAGNSLNVIEIDAASNNGVDNIREIIDEVSYSPAEGKYKVYIIDEVHMLSTGAFNALLKTLEEPPSYVIFILATTEVHKIPITILSRCQRYDFRRIDVDTITNHLSNLMQQEQIETEERALRYIARAADGSLRDSLSLLDQCIAFHYGDKLTFDKVLDVLGAVDTEVYSALLRHIVSQDVSGCISLLDEIVTRGRELTQFVNDFTWYLRNLLLAQTSESLEDAIDMSRDNLARLKEETELLPPQEVIRYIRIFSELAGQMKYSVQKRIEIEIALIKLCRPQMEVGDDAILSRIRSVEKQLEKGVVVAQQPTGTADAVVLGQTEQTKEKIPFPAALPEDVRAVVSQWPIVVGNCRQPMKNHIQGAKLSLAADNSLMIVCKDGLSSDYFMAEPNGEEHRATLQKIVSEVAQKEVQLSFEKIAEEERFEEHYVDLGQIIHMEIEEE